MELSGGTTQATSAIQVIDELTTLHEVTVTLLGDTPPARCHAVVADVELPMEVVDGGVRVTLPRLTGHEMLAFDDA